MSYADSTEVTRKIEKLDIVNTIDSQLLDDSVKTGDELVNAELVDISINPDSPPNAIVRAATLLAQAEYLDNLTALGDDRSPTAVAWTEKAYKILNGWIQEHDESIPSGGYNRENTSKYRAFRGSKTVKRMQRKELERFW